MRNFIQKEDFPYKTITGLVYDSGDYAMNLRKAVDLSNYYGWTKEKTMGEVRSGKEQHLLGVGISTYVEISSLGPEFPQSASLFVNPSGEITVTSGTSPHGQGHETPFAQIVADTLGVSVDEVTVTYGDTAQLPWGTFTAGSRSGALGGSAVLMSARKIRDKMAKISAKLLGVREDDLVFQNGQIFSRNEGQTDKKRLPFRKVASYAYAPPVLPSGLEPALYAYSVYVPSAYAFPFGTHVAVVDIEADTGLIKVLDYTVQRLLGRHRLFPSLARGDARALGVQQRQFIDRQRHHRQWVHVPEMRRVAGALDQPVDSVPGISSDERLINPTSRHAASSKSPASSWSIAEGGTPQIADSSPAQAS